MKRIVLCLLATIAMFSTTTAQAGVGLRFSPISALIGLIDVDLDVGVTEKFVITPNIQSWNLKIGDTDFSIFGYGLSATYRFNGAFEDSWYLGPSFRTLNFKGEDATTRAEADVTAIGGVFGYQWAWTSFYMNLGGFVGSLSSADVKAVDKTTGLETGETFSVPGTLGVGLDFKLGWYF